MCFLRRKIICGHISLITGSFINNCSQANPTKRYLSLSSPRSPCPGSISLLEKPPAIDLPRPDIGTYPLPTTTATWLQNLDVFFCLVTLLGDVTLLLTKLRVFDRNMMVCIGCKTGSLRTTCIRGEDAIIQPHNRSEQVLMNNKFKCVVPVNMTELESHRLFPSQNLVQDLTLQQVHRTSVATVQWSMCCVW